MALTDHMAVTPGTGDKVAGDRIDGRLYQRMLQ
jgi:hypothetical protein